MSVFAGLGVEGVSIAALSDAPVAPVGHGRIGGFMQGNAAQEKIVKYLLTRLVLLIYNCSRFDE